MRRITILFTINTINYNIHFSRCSFLTSFWNVCVRRLIGKVWENCCTSIIRFFTSLRLWACPLKWIWSGSWKYLYKHDAFENPSFSSYEYTHMYGTWPFVLVRNPHAFEDNDMVVYIFCCLIKIVIRITKC